MGLKRYNLWLWFLSIASYALVFIMTLSSIGCEHYPNTGFIFGHPGDEEHGPFIAGFKVLRDGSLENFADDYTLTLNHLPGGLEILGLFFRSDQPAVKAIVAKICEKFIPEISKIKDWDDQSSIFVLALKEEQVTESSLYQLDIEGQELICTDSTIVDSADFLRLRLQGTLSIGFEVPKNSENITSALLSEISVLQNQVQDDSTAFLLDNSNVLLHNNYSENAPIKFPPSTPCSELLSYVLNEDDEQIRRKKKKDSINVVVNFRLLSQLTGDAALKSTVTCAPIMHHEHRQFTFVRIPLPIDVMAYVYPDDPISIVPEVLSTAIVKQLLAEFCCLVKHSKKNSFPVPKPYHFLPSCLNHHLTIVYPDNADDVALEPERRSIHEQYLLPIDRPLLRPVNAFKFANENTSAYLINPHIGLKSTVPGGYQAIVQGNYAYHHYMQDRMDDDGWGCAYRSLQTLISWFRLQGYTQKDIPTHRQIQQILVDIGDKPAKLVGSREWIGSMEVSYVLDNYLDVTSKIMFVSTGAELASKARELALHFDTQGTPIMAGGGVLAQTILGVDWNEETGEVKYLILDPHYTGGEDLKVIQDKGWCGWKDQKFWNQTTYYNLCMPQRPTAI